MLKFLKIGQCDFTVKPSHGVLHKLDTAGHEPCRSRVRRLLPGSPREVHGKKAWQDLIDLGIVERVNPQDLTYWTSALHLQPKTDGKLHACGDFRPLNDKTVLDTYPLPNI